MALIQITAADLASILICDYAGSWHKRIRHYVRKHGVEIDTIRTYDPDYVVGMIEVGDSITLGTTRLDLEET